MKPKDAMTDEDWARLPENVLAILETKDEDKDAYAECRRIESELNAIGYICDWGLC